MLILFLVLITLLAVLAGRAVLDRWFNHLSIYSAIWGSILILVESDLIRYNPISGLAWFYIFSSWLCLFLGSLTVLGIWGRASRASSAEIEFPVLRLKRILWLFSVVGAIGILAQGLAISRTFGSLIEVIFTQANQLYHARVDYPSLGLSGLSYVGAFAPGACTLAGLYTAKVGKLSLAGLMPLVLVALNGILMMGRAGLILAGVWFVVGFIYAPRRSFKIRRWQAVVAVVGVIAVLVGGIIFINQTRGLAVTYYSVSPAMGRASEYFPVLPALFFYYTGPVVGFSDYLSHPENNPHAFWGMYTFAPLLRVASRLGAATDVPFYEENYFTPYDINVMTWLKNIHSDFGGFGILMFPYLLGALMTWLKLKIDENFRPAYLIILADLYLIIFFSFAYNSMFLGVWYFNLVLGLAACYWLSRTPFAFERVPVPRKRLA